MNTALWLSLIVYMVIIVGFVVRGAMKTQNVKDYALGSVNFSPYMVGLSMAASMTSAATFIINPGFVAFYGFSGFLSMAVFLPLGALASLYFLTRGFQKYGQSVKALSLAQWMGSRYSSKGFALYFGFLSLLLIAFIVLICVGLTSVLSQALDVKPLYILIGLVVFVFTYMMFGGANSMVYTNTLQGFLKIAIGLILLASGYELFQGGLFAKLEAIDPVLTKAYNPGSPLFRDFFEVVVCQLIVGVAIVCQPHILTKSLLLKKPEDTGKYLFSGIVIQAFFFTVVLTGLYARVLFPDLMFNGEALKVDSVMSAYVLKQFSPLLGLIVIVGLVSSGLSTLEGLIQSISTTITNDILAPVVGKHILESVWVNKLVIVGLAVVSVVISYWQIVSPDLSVGIFAQNGVYGYFSAAFVPVLFGTFMKNPKRLAVVAASLTALVVHFGIYYGRLTPYMQEPVRNPGISTAIAIVVSLGVGLILNKALKRNSQLK